MNTNIDEMQKKNHVTMYERYANNSVTKYLTDDDVKDIQEHPVEILYGVLVARRKYKESLAKDNKKQKGDNNV